MNERIRLLAEQAGYLPDMFGIGHWDMPEFQKFAQLLVQECSGQCGSQLDQRNILKSFGLEVESNIKYPAPERDGSVNSQYEREYNLPMNVTNSEVK